MTPSLLQSLHKRAGTLLASGLLKNASMFLERERKKKILSTYHRPAPHEERERGLYKIRGAAAPAQESLAPRWRLSSLAMAAKRSVETRCGTGTVGREGEPLASLTAAFGSDCSPPRVQLADLGLIASSLRGPRLICKCKLRRSISNHEPRTHARGGSLRPERFVAGRVVSERKSWWIIAVPISRPCRNPGWDWRPQQF